MKIELYEPTETGCSCWIHFSEPGEDVFEGMYQLAFHLRHEGWRNATYVIDTETKTLFDQEAEQVAHKMGRPVIRHLFRGIPVISR